MKKLSVLVLGLLVLGSPLVSAHGLNDYRHTNGPKKHIGKPIVVANSPAKHRLYRGISISRPNGRAYYGYGHHYKDRDAYKWLAFTAITLKSLDRLNEQAQRDHETAQIRATTAPVGKIIVWRTDRANGSVVAVRQSSNPSGRVCRKFKQTITVGGETQKAFGTACLMPNSVWKITS